MTTTQTLPQPINNWNCSLCEIDTREIGDNFMLNFELWNMAGFADCCNFVCIDCVEVILDRQTTPADFLPCPANDPNRLRNGIAKSEKLISRIGTSYLPWI
jgi:hypothetical protein